MADYTTPKTWTTEILTSPELNAQVRDNITYLKEMGENASIGCIFDGGGATISTDSSYEIEIPGDATVQWGMLRTPDATFDSDDLITVIVRRLASSDADNAFDSDDEIITGLTLDTDTGRYNKFAPTSDWTTALSENDILQFIVPDSSGIGKVTVQLGLHKG